MLHIILLILKIIGIILLCILGILLLAILCVLLVPVRYRIQVSREEGEGKPPFMAKVKITWLLHMVNVRVRYPAEETCVRVRLFVFTLLRLPGKKTRRSPRAESREQGKKQAPPVSPDTEKSEAGEQERAKQKPQENRAQEKKPKKQSKKQELHKKPKKQSKKQELHKKPKKQSKKQSKKQKLHKKPEGRKNIFGKIKEWIQKIQYTIRNFCDKIRSISDQISYYREIIASDAFRQSLQLCRGELGLIGKGLKPRKLEADLVVGMDDPAVTAEILAVYGMLYPLVGEHVRVTGDFEQNRVEGYITVKGRIRGIAFIRAAVRIYFNQNIRKLIQLFKKEAA
ncbi:MAG: DUF2953 domain-containing protein [Clostridiales bacterium]|nr:DUF2953 domain-containing protein [Clostridiales bacterium]